MLESEFLHVYIGVVSVTNAGGPFLIPKWVVLLRPKGCNSYRISAIRHCGYYLFHHVICCGCNSRAATNQMRR